MYASSSDRSAAKACMHNQQYKEFQAFEIKLTFDDLSDHLYTEIETS
jgi:hypothetical protein